MMGSWEMAALLRKLAPRLHLRSALLLLSLLAVVLPGPSVFPPSALGAAARQSSGDVAPNFSVAVICGNEVAARGYLTSALQARANRTSLSTLLGLAVRPARYWYSFDSYTASAATVTLTFYFADGRQPVRDQLQLRRLASGWRIAQIKRLPSSPAITAPPATGTTSVLFTLPTKRPVVALTFDDGPSSYTPQVLAILARYHVHATFFVIGRQVIPYVNVVRAEVAAGDELGNHTYNHIDLRGAATKTIAAELGGTQRAVRTAAGVTPRWFRPEGGAYDAHLTAAAAGLGLRTARWSIDPRDWSRPGVNAIVGQVLTQLRPGGIILLHDGGGDRSQTVAALPVILSSLQSRGYQIESLGEFFG